MPSRAAPRRFGGHGRCDRRSRHNRSVRLGARTPSPSCLPSSPPVRRKGLLPSGGPCRDCRPDEAHPDRAAIEQIVTEEGADASRAGCRRRSALPPPSPARVSVSSSLLIPTKVQKILSFRKTLDLSHGRSDGGHAKYAPDRSLAEGSRRSAAGWPTLSARDQPAARRPCFLCRRTDAQTLSGDGGEQGPLGAVMESRKRNLIAHDRHPIRG